MMAHTMLANPIRALELHYPMIKFLIISNKKAIASANSPTAIGDNTDSALCQ